MHFRAERCTFLQKNAVCRGHKVGNRKKLQEGFRAQESRTLANFHKISSFFDNPSTSYRIGKPMKCKMPLSIQNVRFPKIPLQIPSGTSPKYENCIFGVFFWHFLGIFRTLAVVGEFGCRAGILGLFWGLWGFLL